MEKENPIVAPRATAERKPYETPVIEWREETSMAQKLILGCDKVGGMGGACNYGSAS